jgi:AraC-like DNA-binding protein
LYPIPIITSIEQMQEPVAITRLEAEDLRIRVFVAKYVELSAHSWNSANVQDPFWRLYMNNRAGAALELAEGAYPLEAEQLYLVPAGVRFSCGNAAAVGHFYVHFDVIGVPRVALRELFGGPLRVPDGRALATDARGLASALAERPLVGLIEQLQIKALLYGVLAAYLASQPAEAMERYWVLAAAHAPVRMALREIEEHLPEPLSNRRLAQLCHMSEDYFIRRFRACVGQSPARYIQEQRVLQAAQSLLFSADSIEAIAAATGFANRFYFSRVFASQMGVSPAAYRKAVRV